MCGHTVAEHSNYGSVEFTAWKKKREFKSGAAREDFKRILINNVGPCPSSEFMEDLTVLERHCIRKKPKKIIILMETIAALRVGAVTSNCFCRKCRFSPHRDWRPANKSGPQL